MAQKNTTKSNEVAEQPVDEQVEQAPEVFLTEEDAQDTILSELKMLAQSSGPKGPEARPGRFAPRRQGAIHSVDSNARVEDTDNIERKLAAVNLYQSYVNKRILTGKIFGVRRVFDREQKGKYHYYATVKNGPYQVFIPFEKFAEVDIDALYQVYQRHDTTKSVEDVIKIYLESRLGAEVDYVVTNMPDGSDLEETAFVGGSRAEAMRRNRIHFWFGTTTDGRPLLNIGDKAQARIVAVSRGGIRVEIFGVETFIPSRELSWSMIQDAALEFRVGERLVVRILDIRRDLDNDYAVEYDASVKQAQTDPRVNGMNQYVEGGIYVGKINYIRVPTPDNPNVRPAVFVKLDDGVQCLCPFPNGSVPPTQGANVYVRVTTHDKARRFIYGIISHILR